MQEMLWFNGFTLQDSHVLVNCWTSFLRIKISCRTKTFNNLIKQGTYKSNTFDKRKQLQEQTFVWDLWAWIFKRKKNMDLWSQIQFHFGIWSTSDMLGDGCFAYRRAILLPLWAHNGSTSNTLKSMGETKSGCNNYYYCHYIKMLKKNTLRKKMT